MSENSPLRENSGPKLGAPNQLPRSPAPSGGSDSARNLLRQQHDGAEVVDFTVDGRPAKAPKGQNLLEALLDGGEQMCYFCYHPGISVAACCRQCLIGMDGRLVPSCQLTVRPGMTIESQSEPVLNARRQMLEFTLVNHPVDCVICDKAGECALQRHYMDWDGKASLTNHAKVDKPKKVDIGREIVLDAERCILCSRCIRFCEEVAKEPDLVFEQRGDHLVLTTAPGRRLDNPYSINTVDICPVGALTDKDFRFKIRVWELYGTETTCTGCAAGCASEIHHRDGKLYRMVPPKQWDTNRNWMCDYGRRTYKSATDNRLTEALEGDGQVQLDQAIRRAAGLLRERLADDRGAIGVVFGADATNEDLFIAARFAFDFLEVGAAYLADLPDDGNGDDILRRSDPNPNRAGARACGRGRLGDTGALVRDLEAGKLKLLYVVGDALQLADSALSAVSRVPLIVQATRPSALTRQALVALPAAAWAEVDGTITSFDNTVKRLRPAIEPGGRARPHWNLLRQVAAQLGYSIRFTSAEQIFETMRNEVSLFAAANWGARIPTQLLRFAGRRG